MEPYYLYFASLLLLNSALAYHQHQESISNTPFPSPPTNEKRQEDEEATLALPPTPPPRPSKTASASRSAKIQTFKLTYFPLYALALASDWLQGPYIYTLYAHEKGLPAPTVAALFTTGFVSAAVAATFVGGLADRYGRRRACRVFCVLYAISCGTVLSGDLVLLFVGRVVGGVATTLLFTVFEAWMVGEWGRLGLGEGLGEMFGLGVTVGGVVAIVSGVVGEALVGWTGTKTAPFMAAVGCLGLAWWGMGQWWGENTGEEVGKEEAKGWEGLWLILGDTRILTLSLASAIFEGSMYLFVFFWSPALLSARNNSAPAATTPGDAFTNPLPPPFGLVFSTLMAAMMLGSLLYTSLQQQPSNPVPSTSPSLKPHNTPAPSPHSSAHLLLSILSLASIALLTTSLASSESLTFASFLLFELSVGLYFPTMSLLKNLVVDEGVRAKVYGFMRLPLNVFVVVALGCTRGGEGYRRGMFTVAGACWCVGFWSWGGCLCGDDG